ncbi:hypothetical protein AC1031_011605 [Aphanomyces cochlioides]|nr:hypothetical protein AC1031_011605 [Aphanomyces cochlioides]
MPSRLILPDEDGTYSCPECKARYKISNSIRMHCWCKHKLAIRFTAIVSDEVKQNSMKRNGVPAPKTNERRPIVTTGPSTIERAGAGVFACVDLRAGDIVTTYDGEVVFQVPLEPSYAIKYDFGAIPAWIDGLREFQNGKGIGSFVNRADRELHFYKNCDFIQEGKTLAIEITKNVKGGEELFATYGRSYRM